MTPRHSVRHPPGFKPSPDWVSPIRRYLDRFCGRRGFFLSTFDPALPERFPTLREFIAFRSSANHKPAKSIAMDMDLSPSMLSRKLNPSEGDTQRFNVDDLEHWIAASGDAAAIVEYLSAKFLDTDNTRQARAIHQTEQLLAQLSALLPTLKGVA